MERSNSTSYFFKRERKKEEELKRIWRLRKSDTDGTGNYEEIKKKSEDFVDEGDRFELPALR